MKDIRNLLIHHGWDATIRSQKVIVKNKQKKNIHKRIFLLLEEKDCTEENILFFYNKNGNLVLQEHPALF